MTALKIAGLLLATFGMFFLLACAMTAASKYDATILRVSDDHWLRAMARQAGMPEVRIYFRSLPFDTKIGAYALYLPWERSIVFNSRWLFGTPKEDLVFITAHELAHHVLGHTKAGFWRIALGWGLLFPVSLERQAQKEQEADAYAHQLTGLMRPSIGHKTEV